MQTGKAVPLPVVPSAAARSRDEQPAQHSAAVASSSSVPPTTSAAHQYTPQTHSAQPHFPNSAQHQHQKNKATSSSSSSSQLHQRELIEKTSLVRALKDLQRGLELEYLALVCPSDYNKHLGSVHPAFQRRNVLQINAPPEVTPALYAHLEATDVIVILADLAQNFPLVAQLVQLFDAHAHSPPIIVVHILTDPKQVLEEVAVAAGYGGAGGGRSPGGTSGENGGTTSAANPKLAAGNFGSVVAMAAGAVPPTGGGTTSVGGPTTNKGTSPGTKTSTTATGGGGTTPPSPAAVTHVVAPHAAAKASPSNNPQPHFERPLQHQSVKLDFRLAATQKLLQLGCDNLLFQKKVGAVSLTCQVEMTLMRVENNMARMSQQLQLNQQNTSADMEHVENVERKYFKLLWQYIFKRVFHHFTSCNPDLDETETAQGVDTWVFDSIVAEDRLGVTWRCYDTKVSPTTNANSNSSREQSDRDTGNMPRVTRAMRVVGKNRIELVGELEKLYREYCFVSAFTQGHPNLIRCYSMRHSTNYLYFVMDDLDGADLLHVMQNWPNRQMPEELINSYWVQLLCAVSHCHQSLVCHHDLRPEVISVSKAGHVKLMGFSNALLLREVRDRDPDEIVGVWPYSAPEVLLRKRGSDYDATLSDVWGLGIILADMLIGPGEIGPAIAGYAKMKYRENGQPDEYARLLSEGTRGTRLNQDGYGTSSGAVASSVSSCSTPVAGGTSTPGASASLGQLPGASAITGSQGLQAHPNSGALGRMNDIPPNQSTNMGVSGPPGAPGGGGPTGAALSGGGTAASRRTLSSFEMQQYHQLWRAPGVGGFFTPDVINKLVLEKRPPTSPSKPLSQDPPGTTSTPSKALAAQNEMTLPDGISSNVVGKLLLSCLTWDPVFRPSAMMLPISTSMAAHVVSSANNTPPRSPALFAQGFTTPSSSAFLMPHHQGIKAGGAGNTRKYG
eukprot:CAMPEP_0178986020 /NCGR_PEP_ID=MMETSP0795-20121207/2473_1 /TAXON_ID=88552 /ORGANISM="Amoebophrya sp., Strain Ameob2" /LENGTH=954 /DNA_ID=CAMNT_0020677037 /DNA_START=1390 /DNA_END=4250 /DNA_ORIENTATION=+